MAALLLVCYGVFMRTQGFSLVELSIVLVILGLLTGGILAGQSLIRAAELRSVSADANRYQAALYTFRDKYFALPGDMTNAKSFWLQRAAGTNLACQQTVGVTTGTCNSDGNGQIDQLSGDVSYGERFLIWQHLALAGLIEGSYTGASTSAGFIGISTANSPVGKMSGSVWAEYYMPPISGNPQYFDGSYGANTLMLGTTNGTYLLKPEEYWNLDVKMDDGKPASGKIYSLKATSPWEPNCATTDVVSTSEYNVLSSNKVCTFRLMVK